MKPMDDARGGAGAATPEVARGYIDVDGVQLSFLRAGEGRSVLLLHGTYWSRVWSPVLPLLADGCEAYALDFPGFGASAGTLELDDADVPSLARWALRFLDAVGLTDAVTVVGHDIGGAVAQHLAARAPERVSALGLVNAVLYDSWPVPAVARFRDPAVVASTPAEEIVELRATSLGKAVARELDEREREEYLAPWRDERRARSWMALAGAADSRFTLELVDDLRERALPTVLVWGEDDEFQPIAHAERFVEEIPSARLVRIPGARHIPMEDDPAAVAEPLRRLAQPVAPPRASTLDDAVE